MTSLQKLASKVIFTLDAAFIQIIGIRYLKLLREPTTLERCNYLIENIEKLGRKNIKVLDVGCGAGLSLVYIDKLCRNAVKEYVGIDLRAAYVAPRYKYTKLPHRFLKIDLDSDWQLGKFDVVYCSEVLEHLLEDERLFRKLSSHVASNGIVIVTTPNKNFWLEMAKKDEIMKRYCVRLTESTPPQDGGHVRIGYAKNAFIRMAHNCGMKVRTIDYISPYDLKEWRSRRKLRRFGNLGNILNPLLMPNRARKSPVLIDPPNEELAVRYLTIAGIFATK